MSNWKAVTGLFLATTILESVAMGHLTAYTPLYLGQFGLSPDEVSRWTGLLYGAMMGTAFPLAPFWGALAERYSRRLIIVRSQYFEAISYMIMAFAPNLGWVVVARLLLGLSLAVTDSCVPSAVEGTDGHDRWCTRSGEGGGE